MSVTKKPKTMFKILIKNLYVGIRQIESCKTIEERKKKAVEIGFFKSLNRMKEVDVPAYEEYLERYKTTTGQN